MRSVNVDGTITSVASDGDEDDEEDALVYVGRTETSCASRETGENDGTSRTVNCAVSLETRRRGVTDRTGSRARRGVVRRRAGNVVQSVDEKTGKVRWSKRLSSSLGVSERR